MKRLIVMMVVLLSPTLGFSQSSQPVQAVNMKMPQIIWAIGTIQSVGGNQVVIINEQKKKIALIIDASTQIQDAAMVRITVNKLASGQTIKTSYVSTDGQRIALTIEVISK